MPFQLVHAHILKLGYMVKNARKGQGNKSVDLVIYRPDGTPVPASLSGVHKGLTNAVRAIIALHPIDRGNLDDAALAADIAANGVTGQRMPLVPVPTLAPKASPQGAHYARIVAVLSRATAACAEASDFMSLRDGKKGVTAAELMLEAVIEEIIDRNNALPD